MCLIAASSIKSQLLSYTCKNPVFDLVVWRVPQILDIKKLHRIDSSRFSDVPHKKLQFGEIGIFMRPGYGNVDCGTLTRRNSA